MKKYFKYINVSVKLIIIIIACAVVGRGTNNVVKVSNSSLNMSLDLNAMALRVEEDKYNDIYGAKETYTGHLTGYAADCPLCGGTLACKPSLDVLHGNVNYDDETYGNVAIVASSKNLACGTIIRFTKGNEEDPTIAIVLDRGVLGTAIDLLTESEEYASKYVGRQTITYDVLRKGW